MSNQSIANQSAIAATERQRQAIELRKAGHGFEQIATALGYKDASGAYRAVRAALRKTLQEPTQELRDLECARLDTMLAAIWGDVRKGHVQKIDRALRIMARRADLLGLDAPKRIEDVTDKRREAEQIAAEIGKGDDPAVIAQIEKDLLVSIEVGR